MGDHSNILIGNREASFGSNCDLGEWADYCVIEDDQTIGRMYEDRHAAPDYRWFWSITEHADPALGIVTNGRVPTLDEAKAQFKSSWSSVREAREQKEQQQLYTWTTATTSLSRTPSSLPSPIGTS